MVRNKLIVLCSLYIWNAYSLPLVDPGLFVISGVSTCGTGNGYCLLGVDCLLNGDFLPDNTGGHCEGLRTAFTPVAYFVCCRYNNKTENDRPSIKLPVFWPPSHAPDIIVAPINKIPIIALSSAQTQTHFQQFSSSNQTENEEQFIKLDTIPKKANRINEDKEEFVRFYPIDKEEYKINTKDEYHLTINEENTEIMEDVTTEMIVQIPDDSFTLDSQYQNSSSPASHYFGDAPKRKSEDGDYEIDISSEKEDISPTFTIVLHSESKPEDSSQNEDDHFIFINTEKSPNTDNFHRISWERSRLDFAEKQETISSSFPIKFNRIPVQRFFVPYEPNNLKDKLKIENERPKANLIPILNKNSASTKFPVSREVGNRFYSDIAIDSKKALEQEECVNLNDLVPEEGRSVVDSNCVNIWKFSTKNEQFLCYGVLINSIWLLTSASCITRMFPYGIDNLRASNMETDSGQHTTYGISNMIVHENYKELKNKTETNNLGLVSLSKTVDVSCVPCIPKQEKIFNDQICSSYIVDGNETDFKNSGITEVEKVEAICKGKINILNMFSQTYLTLPCHFQLLHLENGDGRSLWCGNVLAGIETRSKHDATTYTPVSEFLSWIIENIKLYS